MSESSNHDHIPLNPKMHNMRIIVRGIAKQNGLHMVRGNEERQSVLDELDAEFCHPTTRRKTVITHDVHTLARQLIAPLEKVDVGASRSEHPMSL